MLEGRPLYATAADRDYFVAPAVWSQLFGAARRGFNLLLSGPRGVGKTTTLRQVELELRDGGHERSPVFVDATAAQSPLGLVELVREAMRGRPSELRTLAEQAAFTARLLTDRQPGEASTYLVRLVRDLGQEPPHTILVDASGAGEAVYQLFGRLRDELWQLDHRWVVAVDAEELRVALRPPADAFFDVQLSLTKLSDEELSEILRRRGADLSDAAAQEITRLSEGNPRAALSAARQATIEGAKPGQVVAERLWRQEEASRLGRAPAMLMVELEDLGAASASDKALLDRMGWTRERASQVLSELEQAQLVTSTLERQERGRPRKVFRPAERPR